MNNKSISTPGFNLIFFFVLTVFSYQSCVSPRDRSIKEWEKYEWKTVKVDKNDQPTWTIYKRKLVGTNFLEYKIEGDIKSPPKACVASFKQDIHNHANDLKNKKFPTYEIVEESKEGLLTYVIHNEPFPLKDTEMSIRYTFFSDEDGSTGARWREAWDECPVQPSKKLNRIETFRGSWHFLPISSNHNKAVNSVQFELRGMPLWFAELMVLKFLKEGLEDIKETTSKYNL